MGYNTHTGTVDAIAASALRLAALTQSQLETTYIPSHTYDAELHWKDILYQLDVPLCFDWNDEEEPPNPIPDTVLSQLVGQKIGSGMRFNFDGKECYVVGCDFTESRIGSIVEWGDIPTVTTLSAVETRYIDMKA